MKRLLIVMCMLCFSSLAGLCPPIQEYQKEKLNFEIKKHLFYLTVYDKPFSPELLRQALIFEGVQAPDIAFKQAQLETGGFTSELFIVAKNLFGMRYARIRDTYAIGEHKSHAYYNTWLSSVRDYALWQAWYIENGHDLSNYYAFLQDIGYATDKWYISKLKGIS